MYVKISEEERINRIFWNKVNKTDTCWLWTKGGRSKFGYGRCNLDKKETMPHLLSYTILIGEIPINKHVCHSCKNPLCVNPAHLYLDDMSDFSKDAKIRSVEYKKLWAKNYREKHKESGKEKRRVKDINLKSYYGISLEEYEKMLLAQNYTCKICGHEEEKVDNNFKLNLDHCHTTGKVRGLLCPSCNKGLGNFKDNIEHMLNAIKYLKDAE